MKNGVTSGFFCISPLDGGHHRNRRSDRTLEHNGVFVLKCDSRQHATKKVTCVLRYKKTNCVSGLISASFYFHPFCSHSEQQLPGSPKVMLLCAFLQTEEGDGGGGGPSRFCPGYHACCG